MNNPRIVDTALRILSHELGYDSYPELVGWQPTTKQFDSEDFFREDMPMQERDDVDYVPDVDILQVHPHSYTKEEIERIKKKYSIYANTEIPM